MTHVASQRDTGRMSVVTPPATDPLSVDDDIKPHLRISHADEDTLLGNLMSAAVGELESPHGWLGRSLVPQTLRLTLDARPPAIVYLPGPPVTEVKTITVREADDTLVVIYDIDAGPPATDTIGLLFDLTAEPALIWPDDDIGWPSDIKGDVDSVRIEYVAGYAAVPKLIKQWLLMRIGEMYRDRENSVLGVASNPLLHANRMLDGLRVHS